VTRGAQIEPQELARRLAAIADDKGARDLMALDVR
jgi:ribosomal silencing factor RsfS